LASAGQLRGDLAAEGLATRQLEWIIGRNPFAESTMYGEGYDFVPLYSPSSGDMVGGLPVGIQTRGEADAPYWPVQAMWTYKEIWGHPVTNWIWLLSAIEGPATVQGRADAPVIFEEAHTHQRITVNATSGHFKTTLPEGEYKVTSGGRTQTQTFLPGSSYELECRPSEMLNYTLTKQTDASGGVTIRLLAQGNGQHRFSFRTDNLILDDASKEVGLQAGKTAQLEWHGHIPELNKPWVAVAVPDNKLSERKELRGSAWDKD